MKLAITQPNYLPWLGYFDLLDEVDCWVSFDNVDLTKRSFIVRNRIKLLNGDWKWLSVRVASFSRGTSIRQAELADSDFAERHFRMIEANYRKAPFFDEYIDWLKKTLEPRERSVAEYNERVVRALADRLGISVEFRRSSQIIPELAGTAQDKIMALCEELGEVDSYYNFAGGIEEGLYQPGAFAGARMRLIKQEYDHPTYAQLGEEFVPYMSVVDLLLNEGPNSLEIIRGGRNYVDMTAEL